MHPHTTQTVKSEIVFWTAGFVLLTLLVNAPLLPWVLKVTGLAAIPDKQLARRKRAVEALAEHTAAAIEELRREEDELLTGKGGAGQWIGVKPGLFHMQAHTWRFPDTFAITHCPA